MLKRVHHLKREGGESEVQIFINRDIKYWVLLLSLAGSLASLYGVFNVLFVDRKNFNNIAKPLAGEGCAKKKHDNCPEEQRNLNQKAPCCPGRAEPRTRMERESLKTPVKDCDDRSTVHARSRISGCYVEGSQAKGTAGNVRTTSTFIPNLSITCWESSIRLRSFVTSPAHSLSLRSVYTVQLECKWNGYPAEGQRQFCASSRRCVNDFGDSERRANTSTGIITHNCSQARNLIRVGSFLPDHTRQRGGGRSRIRKKGNSRCCC